MLQNGATHVSFIRLKGTVPQNINKVSYTNMNEFPASVMRIMKYEIHNYIMFV